VITLGAGAVRLRRLALALALVATAGARGVSAQATATWYIPTYTNDILVWDEASERIVDRIRMQHQIPNEVALNESRDRLYVLEATGQHMEIVDLDTRRVIDAFTLSRGDVTVRIDGLAVHPSDERAILVTKRYTKGRDRYTVEGPFLLEYDLERKQVTDTLDWPDGRERDRGFNFRYSPDGETLYFMADDVIALDAETYEEVDRWNIEQPLEPGLGRPNFSLNPGTYDEPGVSTGIFRMTDPVQNRSMLGIAEVRLAAKEVDFFTLGPAEPLRGFALAPGGTRAYSLYSEIGRYEFWEFDLAGRRVARRHPFAGRPRMGIQASADGEKVYVYVAGNTIDVYDADSLELLRTIAFDEDMTLGNVVVIPGAAP
jgi:DNA-binding beta-propeller fold protein YncE